MKPSDIKITPIYPKDASRLLKICRETFYESFGPPINKEENVQHYFTTKITLKHIIKEIQNPDSEFYFISVQNKIAGYLKLNQRNAQTEKVVGKAMEIERIYVKNRFQGQKIGKLLLNKAFHIAQQNKVTFIWLGVWEKNIKAIKFYERHGFKPFDKHQFMLGSDVQTDIMMKFIF